MISASGFQAEASSQDLLAAEDDGLLYEGETPQRQLRLTSIERHIWTNPANGAVLSLKSRAKTSC